MIVRRPEQDGVPVLRREAIIPVTNGSWLWSYIVIKGVLVTLALVTMAIIGG